MAGKYFAWPWKIQLTYKIPDEIAHTTFEWFLLLYVGECTKTMLTKWYNSWEHTLLYCMYQTKCTQSLSGLEFFCSNSCGISVSNAMNIYLFMLTEHLIIELIQVKKHIFIRLLQKILIILGSSMYLLSNSVSAFYLNIIH